MIFRRRYSCIFVLCVIFVISSVIFESKNMFNVQPSTTNRNTAYDVVMHAQYETCVPRDLSYVKDSDPKRIRTALASFPGSGNTWVRHLIQQLTGYYTGSVYNDNTLARKGFLGERASINDPNQQCIVYKTHKRKTAAFQKAIIIIRHPLNAIKAYFNYRYSRKYPSEEGKVGDIQKNYTLLKQERHTGIVSSALFRSRYFRMFLKKNLHIWEINNVEWLEKFRGKCVVVLYENLRKNISFELMRIATFLKIHALPKHVMCTVENSEGNFHRDQKKSNLDILFLLNENQKNLIDYAVQNVSNVVKRLNMSLDISQYFV